jgi:HEAT repeat protein
MPAFSTPSAPLCAQLAHAVQQTDAAEVERLVDLLDDSTQRAACLDVWHMLLLAPFHYSHQRVTMILQRLADPQSIPFLRQALATGFEYVAYTQSEDAVIAKWFSHALFAIGTPDAIQVLREFAQSDNPGIRTEMQYRLAKLR